jgi:cell division protein FtsI (penicillin-binding protein 3)
LANGYASIANGGILKKPYIVESVTDVETGETQVTQPQDIRRVVSAETAAKMRLMLAGVTEKGSGQSARVPGYIVAGKTGTAQKIKTNGRGYMQGGYIGSFTGFIPANDPKYVIFVGIDHPRKGYYGAVVAAPLFSKIASYAVRKSGITPDVITDSTLTKSIPVDIKKNDVVDKVVKIENREPTPNETQKVAPYLKNLTMREVIGIAAEENIQVKFVGAGKVETTYPDANQSLDENRQMTVILK